MFLKNNLIFIFIFFISCQPVEILSPVDFDNSRLDTISINAKEISINVDYNPIFSEENIEDQLMNSPLKILKSWIDNNIVNYGNENKLSINIIDASILKKEINNIDAKKYEEKTIFLYEVFFLVEYTLYDDNDYLLAITSVESTRSTTSKKYISLNEKEVIINNLLNQSIKDFISETNQQIKLYMGEFL